MIDILVLVLTILIGCAAMRFAYVEGVKEGRSQVKDDRDALARAAHAHYCLTPGEETHEPDEVDYDKADEVIEILWRLDR